MRIVFIGSGELGMPSLRALHAQHEVALVVTQPDRPAGRRKHMTPTPIAGLAAELGIPIEKTPKINSPESLSRIRDARADANVVVAFGQKIGPDVISSPRLGAIATINLHASLLPKYRGAAPVHWSILRGETVTGNTVFSLVEKMDAGRILGCQSTPIDPMETAGELHDRLAAMGPDLLLEVLAQLHTGTHRPQEQDHSLATLAPKLSRADAVLDFTQPAEALRLRVHGLTPWPGVRVVCDTAHGPLELKLHRVQPVDGQGEPGTMISEGVVATGAGGLGIIEVQPVGKRLMTWADFSHGAHLPLGTRFRPAT